jgi:hypothetical protein
LTGFDRQSLLIDSQLKHADYTEKGGNFDLEQQEK